MLIIIIIKRLQLIEFFFFYSEQLLKKEIQVRTVNAINIIILYLVYKKC